MSLHSYQRVQNQTEDPRKTEYRLFALVTKAMMDAGSYAVYSINRYSIPIMELISGTEVELGDDELHVGSMTGAVKARDLLRDGRLALHSPTVDPPEGDESAWAGEAKVAGRAVEVPSDDASHRFRIDVDEAGRAKW